MELSAGSITEAHVAMGFFSLYVVVISLVRIMADEEFPRLTAMKRLWGRRRGLATYFVSNVALPMVVGIVFITRGVAGFGASERAGAYDVVAHQHVMTHILSTSAASSSPKSLADHGYEELDYWGVAYRTVDHPEMATCDRLDERGIPSLPFIYLP